MTSRGFAQFVGILFIAVGLLGFVPGVKSIPPVGSAPGLVVEQGFGHLFGLFPVNWVHNLVHLGVGVTALYSARSMASSRQFARGLTWFYGVLAVMGLFPVLNVTFGLIPIYGHDIWLHALTAAGAAYFGFGRRAELLESAERYRRAA
ncbi:MAG TPA: DUF4383 domain-containing protein [Nitrospira sp.]|nr:DUF4383 domain-containing protein [Nitrospira sp.]